jgi:hypothetical protein
VTFQTCTSTERQQWVANGHANFEGVYNKAHDNFCFNVEFPDTSGSGVILESDADGDCNNEHDNIETFMPKPEVGAGAAGASSKQLVNYQQFGRCMDVPHGGTYNWTAPMISWPCKQSPDPSVLPAWNEVWYLPTITAPATSASGKINAKNGTSTYCLQGPASKTAPDQHVILAQTCGSGANQTWTVYGETHDENTRYHIVNNYGYCLAPSVAATDGYYDWATGNTNNDISNILVQACSNTAGQKWNAPPLPVDSIPLKDLDEIG